MASTDAVIIGGGHNGLAAAAYLAKTGWKVLVLERRPIVGGAWVTEEIHLGNRSSSSSSNPRTIRWSPRPECTS